MQHTMILCSAAEIIQANPDFFKSSNFFIDALRSLGWVLVLLIRIPSMGCDHLLNAVYDFLTISESESFLNFFSTFRPLIVVGLTISLLILGNVYMFTEKRPEVIKNFIIGLMVVFAAPQVISTMNQALFLGKQALYSEQSSTTDTIIAANIIDLRFLDSNGWNVGDQQGKYNSLDSTGIRYLDAAEHVTKSDNGISSLGQTIFNTMFTVNSSGELVEEKIGSKGWFDIFDPPYYYRYSIHFFQIIILLIINIFVLVFASYKAFTIIAELMITRILGVLFSMEITSGQKTKKIIESFFTGYLSLFFILVCQKLYGIFQVYINAQNYNAIVRVFMLIFAALVVLEGPNIVEKVLGVDVGLSNGAMKFFTAFRVSQEISRAMPHGGHFSGFGRESDGNHGSRRNDFFNGSGNNGKEPNVTPPTGGSGGATYSPDSADQFPISDRTVGQNQMASDSAGQNQMASEATGQNQMASDTTRQNQITSDSGNSAHPEAEPDFNEAATGTFEPDGSISYADAAAAAATAGAVAGTAEMDNNQNREIPESNSGQPTTAQMNSNESMMENHTEPTVENGLNLAATDPSLSNGSNLSTMDPSPVEQPSSSAAATSADSANVSDHQPDNNQSKTPSENTNNLMENRSSSDKDKLLDTKFRSDSISPGIIKGIGASGTQKNPETSGSGTSSISATTGYADSTPNIPGGQNGTLINPASGFVTASGSKGNINGSSGSNTTIGGNYSHLSTAATPDMGSKISSNHISATSGMPTTSAPISGSSGYSADMGTTSPNLAATASPDTGSKLNNNSLSPASSMNASVPAGELSGEGNRSGSGTNMETPSPDLATPANLDMGTGINNGSTSSTTGSIDSPSALDGNMNTPDLTSGFEAGMSGNIWNSSIDMTPSTTPPFGQNMEASNLNPVSQASFNTTPVKEPQVTEAATPKSNTKAKASTTKVPAKSKEKGTGTSESPKKKRGRPATKKE